jgi:NADH dehydrogenase FAD-containing subunit
MTTHYVADVIKRRAKGKDPRSYHTHKPITVIPVGERWATVVWGKVTLSGIIGWVLRELADLVAFTDYEPWWKAGRQWLVGLEEEEPCRICQQAMHKNIRQIA